jgi:hypothetical protein
MKKPTLMIMAAGIGSRYGGLKQIDAIGPNDEIIMDYSIYDALKAGFGKIVFIINRNIEEAFRKKIGDRVDKIAETAYVFQDIREVPQGFEVPLQRVKPWGTGHAVFSARHVVDTPFAVINADDFYGSETYHVLFDHLKNAKNYSGKPEYCMAGFQLEKTLTENGDVARGVCKVNDAGYLDEIHERTRIKKIADGASFTEDGENWIKIPQRSLVSMNAWGFSPDFLMELEEGFPKFLSQNKENILKAEYFLPAIVNDLILQKKANVKVLPCNERWYGVTYQEDKPMVKEAISNMVKQGVYPDNLWRDIK